MVRKSQVIIVAHRPYQAVSDKNGILKELVFVTNTVYTSRFLYSALLQIYSLLRFAQFCFIDARHKVSLLKMFVVWRFLAIGFLLNSPWIEWIDSVIYVDIKNLVLIIW